MRRITGMLMLLSAILTGCAADRPPEEITADGLARVPSRSAGGVYRAPGAVFTQYRRIILEPPSISFVENWEKKHERLGKAEIARMRAEAVELFREEFTRELIDRGPYEMAEAPDADVLLVVPAIEDLDIVAPDAGLAPGVRTYTKGPVTMQVTGELRDAPTGKLVGRVIMYQPAERYAFNDMRIANRVTNAHEQRLVYAKWARLVHEALSVAKVEKPRPPASPQ